MDRTGFENLRVYQLAEEIGDLVWETVIKWHRLAQDTTGKQLINSVDSIGANRLTEEGCLARPRWFYSRN